MFSQGWVAITLAFLSRFTVPAVNHLVTRCPCFRRWVAVTLALLSHLTVPAVNYLVTRYPCFRRCESSLHWPCCPASLFLQSIIAVTLTSLFTFHDIFVGESFRWLCQSGKRSSREVQQKIPVWISFVVNPVPVQSEGFPTIQKLTKRIA